MTDLAERASKTTIVESPFQAKNLVKRDELVIGTMSDDLKRLHVLWSQLHAQAMEMEERLKSMPSGDDKTNLLKACKRVALEHNLITYVMDASLRHLFIDYEDSIMGVRRGWLVVVPKNPAKRRPSEGQSFFNPDHN